MTAGAWSRGCGPTYSVWGALKTTPEGGRVGGWDRLMDPGSWLRGDVGHLVGHGEEEGLA